jgi:hypothetical protein
MPAYLRENFWIVLDSDSKIKNELILSLEEGGVIFGENLPKGPSNLFHNCKATAIGKILMEKLFSEGFILYGNHKQ